MVSLRATTIESAECRDAAILLVCAALLLLPGLGRMRATENTDARYLEISRAMYASGDWLVPRLAGRPHLDKPPLTYWAASLGYAALGVTPFAGRLLEQLVLAGYRARGRARRSSLVRTQDARSAPRSSS